CFDNRQGFTIAAHIPSSYLIYYLGNGNFIELDEKVGLLTITGNALEQFHYFNQEETKKMLQRILGTNSTRNTKSKIQNNK
ncbi:2865_t:CDS:1, partial [Funneliformis caledonium]